MYKKLLTIFILLFISQLAQAQHEFITVWKPSNPSTNVEIGTPSTANQIWFPGIGTNFDVSWSEIGYPSHTGSFTVTSSDHFLIDFGTPQNANANDATYEVKISNGSGSFSAVKFPGFAFISPALRIPTITAYHGDVKKILGISQWGNIQWTTMEWAFAGCTNLDVTATDIPDLSGTNTTLAMFYNCTSLIGNASFGAWDTSSITNMSHMFASAGDFNQPMANWNTSQVTNMDWMFHYLPKFNQPIGNWDTSKVTSMMHMLHICTKFNQDLGNWDTSKVTDMRSLLDEAHDFNHSLADWNLGSLSQGNAMIADSGIDCANYDDTLIGWANNPATPSGINVGVASPLIYSSPAAVTARTYLLSNKGWIITGDLYNAECRSSLSTSETASGNTITVYPNPASEFLYVKNIKGLHTYTIVDLSGRIIVQNPLTEERIDVSFLTKGNYILRITGKEKTQNFKFIKK